MGTLLFILAGTLPPAAGLLALVNARGGSEREPLGVVARAYVIGLLTAVPAFVSLLLSLIGIDIVPSRIGLPLRAGLIEETSKFCFAIWLVYPLLTPSRSYTAVVSGAAIGLGFATVESLVHAFAAYRHDTVVQVVLARSLFGMPFHASLGVIMGWFVGRARAAPGGAMRRGLLIVALALPIALHAVDDALTLRLAAGRESGAGSPPGAAILASMAAFFGTLALAWGLIERARPLPTTVLPERPASVPSTPLSDAMPDSHKFCNRCRALTRHQGLRCLACGAGWRFGRSG